MKNRYGFWREKANVLADAKTFQTVSKWRLKSPGAYASARDNNWMKEATKHMRSRSKWNKFSLIKDASKYKTPSAWKAANPSAYTTACAINCRDLCIAHMTRIRQPNGFWTLERIIESARKYQTKRSWELGEPAAYDAASRSGSVPIATKHMVSIYSHGEYSIYQFLLQHDIEFTHQKRYGDLKDRSYLFFDFHLPAYNLLIEYQGRQHYRVSDSSRYKSEFNNIVRRDELKRSYVKENNLEYLEVSVYKYVDIGAVITAKLSDIECTRGEKTALVKRDLSSDELNKLATLGRWSNAAVLADIEKFKDWAEWVGTPAYNAAARYGWLDDVKQMLKSYRTHRGHWQIEKCIESAKNFATRKAWQTGCRGAYQAAWTNGWLGDCTTHMRTVRKKWSHESCLKSALHFKNRTEWAKGEGGACNMARRNGWMSACCAHMEWRGKQLAK